MLFEFTATTLSSSSELSNDERVMDADGNEIMEVENLAESNLNAEEYEIGLYYLSMYKSSIKFDIFIFSVLSCLASPLEFISGR